MSCPAIGVKSSIIILPKTERAKAIFSYFSRKIRNFNPHNFELFLESASLPSIVDGLPLRFTRMPVSVTCPIRELTSGVVIMEAKSFADAVLEDQQTLANHRKKLVSFIYLVE